MKHALLPPSSAHRWLKCPGSVAANADKPWEQSSAALLGTSAHALLEVCLRLHADPMDFIGQTLGEDLLPVDEEMADAVGYALDYVRGYMADNKKAVLHIEKPVYPAKMFGVKNQVLWGTPDVQLVVPKVEVVTLDYKHGIGIPVPVKDNPQIKLYHVGRRVSDGKFNRYKSVVVQPRLARRKPVQEHSITDKDLLTWADDTVRPVIPIALGDDAPRVAGDWCTFCHASGSCPAQLKQAFDRAAKEFKGVPRDPKRVAPAELARYLDMLPMVKEAIGSLEQVAIRAVHAGVKVPGYEATFTRPRRVWRDEEQANKVLTKLGLETRERYTVELLTPAKAEEALRAKGKIARRKRGQPRQASPLDDVIAYTEQNPSIGKIHDN